ncbi:bifunctional nuclease domain-containing protein [Corynebacterium mucifaciens]|uniref:Bifunctional DNase/RNase n=1 Tax=Corynebacterium mucifaciens TaxID=57171 RepID=A0A7X6LQI5_9CORY|nr:bifunctional nuclease domain-containing protein [Corynebacterium mucifaciens]NKY68378.1 bifunctional nuclease family protein [Corynebacterium mucifaciens]
MEGVTLVGVFPVGPEDFLCALLQRPSNGRCIPVWLPPMEGAELAARLSGWAPRRPRPVDAMAELIRTSVDGAASLELSSYVDGTFMSTLTLDSGVEIDLRASDALLLAHELDMELAVDDTVAAEAAVFISEDDAERYLQADIEVEGFNGQSVSASGDAQADADFEALMRSLGVEDADLGDDNPKDG